MPCCFSCFRVRRRPSTPATNTIPMPNARSGANCSRPIRRSSTAPCSPLRTSTAFAPVSTCRRSRSGVADWITPWNARRSWALRFPTVTSRRCACSGPKNSAMRGLPPRPGNRLRRAACGRSGFRTGSRCSPFWLRSASPTAITSWERKPPSRRRRATAGAFRRLSTPAPAATCTSKGSSPMP